MFSVPIESESTHMKKFLIVFLVLLATGFSKAQILEPTTWKVSLSKDKPSVGEEITIFFDATIDPDWYLYSSDFDPDLGPILTSLSLNEHTSFRTIGKLVPQNPKKKFDPVWEGEVTYFTKKARFTQKVLILAEKVQLQGNLEFQSCTDVDGRCINGKKKIDFNFTANQAKQTEAKNGDTEEVEAAKDDLVNSETKIQKPDTVLVSEGASFKQGKSAIEQLETQEKPVQPEETGLLKFLLLAFGAGIASIFMPCIYPIMPITVSYFTKQKDGKIKAFFYGICILLIFGVMGFVTMLFGAPFLNFLSTHWVPNLIFFLLFVLFGISLLGGFEIVLPHKTVNQIDGMSERGGYIGIFFMALTLVVVSFSCTVPFVGSLLILSAGGEVIRPLYGMLAFGLPFALVFTLLAMFPQWLKNLPKSGGWLNELKAVFGFLEFALALKFLSNIDLAYHFNLLHRNIFLVIWIAISLVITLYILGFMRLPKDSKVEKWRLSRVGFAMLFALFTFYMVPGVTGKPLNALSGILPPLPVNEVVNTPLPDGMRALPHGLLGFARYPDALAYAKEVNKPVLLDFTGYACANCRKMEEFVWPQEMVLEKLRNDYVIASLYVDDKRELPEAEHYVSTYDNELKTTVGEQNMDLEITKLNNNAQPYYAVVDVQGNILKGPLGYSSAEDFAQFLADGKQQFLAKENE